MTRYKFLERARDIHGYKYQYPNLSDKILSKDNITVVLNDIEYTQKVVKHLIGRCPEKNTPIKTTDEFIRESKEIWGNKYDYSLVLYKGALDKVKIIYDGEIFEQVAVSHLNYAPEKQLNSFDDFVNKSNIVHKNKYTYSNYILSSKKLTINCSLHGDFLQKPLLHIKGDGCPDCIETKVYKSICKILDSYNISYYKQHRFEIGDRFDFYIPSIRTCIDFNNDDISKLDYCEDNYIELICINYDQVDNINEILKNYIK